MTMSDACFLAVDSSCYTTSVAVVSKGEVIFDKRKMLSVQKGKRGLRQSEAVFMHVKNFRELFFDYAGKGIKAVACSASPCLREGSYMPVFCVGESVAISCTSALGVPHYALSHQHGHLYAAFFGNNITDGRYCAFHVSGGTLDILSVFIKEGIVTEIEPIGTTLDITCGQLIDRVGVAAGLEFPSGAQMERLYTKNGTELSVCVNGLNANLSGAETQAMRMLKDGVDKTLVCSGVIDCVSETIIRLIKNAADMTGIKNFVFTGGVICNKIVRGEIAKACQSGRMNYLLAKKEYCTDNACGLALAAEILHNKGEKI